MRKLKYFAVTAVMMCTLCIPSYAKTSVAGHGVNVTAAQPGASVTGSSNAMNAGTSAVTSANIYGSWAADAKGWWWKNPDGTWPKNTWAWLDGNHDGVSESYYFGPDGYMLANTVTPDGYMVNGNGAWISNGIVQTKMTSIGTSSGSSNCTSNTVTTKTVTSSGDEDNDSYSSSYSSSSSDFDEEEWADEVISLVNKERRKAGRSTLEKDDTLMEVAQIRAEEASEKFSHTRPDGSTCFTAFDEAGFDPNAAAGENLANGYSSPAAVMNGWMHSSGHKANILSKDFSYIGVGVYKKGGTYCWAQAFGGE